MLFLVAAFLMALAGRAWTQPESEGDIVDIVEVRGLIDEPVAGHLTERLNPAGTDTDAVVLQMDTPGALDGDVAALADLVADNPVPVFVWIAPRGAEVRGATSQIAFASDGIFMATDTHIDNLPDARTVETSSVPGSGATPASGSTPAVPAIPPRADQFPFKGQASSLADLLRSMDGLVVGGDTLETWDAETQLPSATLRFQDMGALAQLLHVVTSPQVAIFLLLIGAFGLIFEAYNPGIGLAAIIGVASLGLALYGLDALPTNWLGILVILAGIVALVYDVHVAGFGPPTILGLAAVGAGAKFSFPASPDAISLDWWVTAAAVITTLVFFVSVMTAALRVRLRRPVTGDDAVIGTIAEAQTDIAPEGTVITKGTVWRARTMETGIAAGEKVKVMASEGFVLLVEPLHEGSTETD